MKVIMLSGEKNVELQHFGNLGETITVKQMAFLGIAKGWNII